MFTKRWQRGFSLIEQIMFIVIVGIGIMGLLGVMNSLTRSGGSVDPLLQKQALAIAESLMSEIQRQSFSYCDPDDPNAVSATSGANCTAGLSQDTLSGPIPSSEQRAGTDTTAYDHVTDYARPGGLVLNPVTDQRGTQTFDGYQATITLDWADTTFGLPNGSHQAVRIDIEVRNGPTTVTLTGYRLRYDPQL